jgi:uncharacterized protein
MATASASPIIVFAHGAGAPSASAWMRGWATRLGELGDVSAFDYPYMKAGRKSPDRPPVLLAAHREALDEARKKYGEGRPVVLAGKSMGSRMGCHLAVELAKEGQAPAALVCFGYPLRGGSGTLRDEVLRELETPILFLQGSRDALCPLDDLERVRGQMRARNQLFVVDGGDHSLGVRKKGSGPGTQPDWDERVLAAVRGFFAELGVHACKP